MFAVRPFETKTISWWYSQINNIDLDPPYQRRSGLWNKKEQSYLIDTIINVYDIPKFYIADFSYVNTSLNINKKQYAVIDGKQRLSAIFNFFNNELRLGNDIIYEKDPKKDIAGLNFSEIKEKFPEICTEIDNFNIHVVSVITDDKRKIDDLFVRLNKGKALTGAEIRSAMKGQIPLEISKLAKHDFFKYITSFSTSRKQDENVTAKLLLIEINNSFVDTKKFNLDKLVNDYANTEASDIKIYTNKVNETLDVLLKKFSSAQKGVRSSGYIPLYYWFFRNNSYYDGEYIEWFELNLKRSEPNKNFNIFNLKSRSINDKENLIDCYNILVNEYKNYYDEKQKNNKESKKP